MSIIKDNSSSVSLKSNIILKSQFERNERNYLPIDLLPKEYFDTRSWDLLTKKQQQDLIKKAFFANKIIDVIEKQDI